MNICTGYILKNKNNHFPSPYMDFYFSRKSHTCRTKQQSVRIFARLACVCSLAIGARASGTFKTHLDNIGFVSLQDLNGLSGLWVDNKDAGVASLSDQTLPTPMEEKRRSERSHGWKDNRGSIQNQTAALKQDVQTFLRLRTVWSAELDITKQKHEFLSILFWLWWL